MDIVRDDIALSISIVIVFVIALLSLSSRAKRYAVTLIRERQILYVKSFCELHCHLCDYKCIVFIDSCDDLLFCSCD